ncbi:MAG TPA: tryptophan synthase subunit alpha [Candidatus Acidoferrales bacterium]|nr:tryptophan synthase subunit alpha [Candidatus Acidoferrales bacterium]
MNVLRRESPSAPAPAVTAAPTRIGRRFDHLRRAGELGLVAYVTAGDPSLGATHEIVLAAAEAGADVIELGVPFSDPIADGPVIQRASERALRSGTTLASVIDLVSELRRSTDVPLVLFGYFNPILQMKLEVFAERATLAGADGVLVTDLTPEEAGEFCAVARAAGLDTIFLAAPTTTAERIRRIAQAASGFLYLISRTGVTGQRDRLPPDLSELVERARRATTLPLAVGFGLSRPEHIRALVGKVDAAVVGSALVAEIENAAPAAAAEAVAARVRQLKRAGRER